MNARFAANRSTAAKTSGVTSARTCRGRSASQSASRTLPWRPCGACTGSTIAQFAASSFRTVRTSVATRKHTTKQRSYPTRRRRRQTVAPRARVRLAAKHSRVGATYAVKKSRHRCHNKATTTTVGEKDATCRVGDATSDGDVCPEGVFIIKGPKTETAF